MCRDAKHVEEISGDNCSPYPFGFGASGQVEHGFLIGCQTTKGVCLIAEVQIVWIGRTTVQATAEIARVDCDQALRLFNASQRTQHQSVDETEDRGVCTDAQSEGHHRQQREAWTLCDHAQTVACVLPECVHIY